MALTGHRRYPGTRFALLPCASGYPGLHVSGRYHRFVPQDYELRLVSAGATPADKPWDQGIEVRTGATLPFRVVRSWSGPAGHYNEQWSIRRGMQEVVYEHPPFQIRVRGMQSISEYTDRIEQPVTLEEGNYELVFVVEGRFMGSVEIKVIPSAGAAA